MDFSPRDLIKLAAFVVAIVYLAKTLRMKPWKDEARWRAWLINTALLLVILAAFSFIVPSFEPPRRRGL